MILVDDRPRYLLANAIEIAISKITITQLVGNGAQKPGALPTRQPRGGVAKLRQLSISQT